MSSEVPVTLEQLEQTLQDYEVAINDDDRKNLTKLKPDSLRLYAVLRSEGIPPSIALSHSRISLPPKPEERRAPGFGTTISSELVRKTVERRPWG